MINRRIGTIFLLSFSSGLPLTLVASTLQAWYTQAGVGLMTIGWLSLLGQPYIYKFLWAPLLDKFQLPFLSRRRDWIFVFQCGLVLTLLAVAFQNPSEHPWRLATFAFLVAFCSASQDIVIDAYRADLLETHEVSWGAAANTFGYRIAMIVGGALALLLAAQIGWRAMYCLMAGFIALELMVTAVAPAVAVTLAPSQKTGSWTQMIVDPWKALCRRPYASAILVFIVLYKICDALILALSTSFLLRGIGFDMVVVATLNKGLGLGALLLGSAVGAVLLTRMGLYRSLLWFGILQTLSSLSYLLLAWIGKSKVMLIIAVFTENYCSGLATVAFVSLLTLLCDQKFSATQYAGMSALAGIGRVCAGPLAAWLVGYYGWERFYFVGFLSGFPSLLLLFWLKNKLHWAAPQEIL